MAVGEEADVVVIGAGHNGLICAAYLAEAGLRVVVLEAAHRPGGNTITEELTLPGFAHDSCSSAHVLIQSNPLLADDELGLQRRWGLRYVHTDPAVVLPRADGDTMTVHRDLDATADEIGRWSAADAAAFRKLVDEWQGGLAAVHGRWSSGLDLGDSAAAEAYREMRGRSAWDVVHERFGHPGVRDLLLWLSFATIQDPRRAGTGVLPASITAGRLRFGWSTPIGGSGALPAALIRLLEARGGAVECDAVVDRVEVRNGRAVAVRTQSGRQVKARRAVVASCHLAKLGGMLDAEPADLAEARAAWRPGLSVFAVHAALRRDLPIGSAAVGLGGAEGLARQLDAFARGETDASDPWLLVVNQTVVDPGRAPDGGGTFKILTVAPWERADGRAWDEAKHEYAERIVDRVRERVGEVDILAMRAESPVDVAAHNAHNLGGSCHGGEFRLPGGKAGAEGKAGAGAKSAARATGGAGVKGASDEDWLVGWPDYATSIPGLYLTGSTSHPGGSVSGRPGRNAARTIMRDMGLDPGVVMDPSR